MTLPRTVRVGPHRYKIVVVPDGALDSAGQVGHCNSERLVIALSGDQEPSQLADTLLHELGHALLRTLQLSDEDNERVCLVLGPGLLGLVRDNPRLIAWLQEVA